MTGSHAVLDHGRYYLDYCPFFARLREHDRQVVPRFLRYQQVKKELIERCSREARLEEFQAKVSTTFVRNKLIDKVYLPLVGENLARQIGTADATRRTDCQGLLLLISPPGYGKTTLMEIRGQPPGADVRQDQRPGGRQPRHEPGPLRGARRRRPRGARETQPGHRDGRQRDALRRRHPALQPGVPPEVYLAVRRPAAHRGRLQGPHAHLRPPRQAPLRGHGGQPLHRKRTTLPHPGHARQPLRHVQHRRHRGRLLRGVLPELHRELPHVQPHALHPRHAQPARRVRDHPPRPGRGARRPAGSKAPTGWRSWPSTSR